METIAKQRYRRMAAAMIIGWAFTITIAVLLIWSFFNVPAGARYHFHVGDVI